MRFLDWSVYGLLYSACGPLVQILWGSSKLLTQKLLYFKQYLSPLYISRFLRLNCNIYNVLLFFKEYQKRYTTKGKNIIFIEKWRVDNKQVLTSYSRKSRMYSSLILIHLLTSPHRFPFCNIHCGNPDYPKLHPHEPFKFLIWRINYSMQNLMYQTYLSFWIYYRYKLFLYNSSFSIRHNSPKENHKDLCDHPK